MIKNKINFLVISFLLLFISCDELSKIPLNIPIPLEFNAKGSNTSFIASDNFCLSEFDEWKDNQDDLNSVKFLSASYWTLSSTPNLTADINFTIYDNQNNVLFSFDMSNVNAQEYTDQAYIYSLTKEQIEAVNNYISNLSNNDKCFSYRFAVTNVTGDKNSNGQFELNGKVELLFEADINL